MCCRFDAIFKGIDSLREEIDFLEKLLEELDFPIYLNHNDISPRNIIYDESTGN